MRIIVCIAFLSWLTSLSAQTVHGIIMDDQQMGVSGIRVKNVNNNQLARTDYNGQFTIKGTIGDSLLAISFGYDTTLYVVDKLNVKFEIPLVIQDIGDIKVKQRRLADFDVGYLPPIKGVQIYTGTNQLIQLDQLSGAKSTSNPREMFAKIPGINIWESDGAGIQIGIGGRGLSPNRTANFNTRQNGYDISADALGYPESYYTPPFEALEAIEIIRGSASLQFGTQFGGLLNFIIKAPPVSTSLEFTSRNTGGSYGYFGTFNRIAGTKNRVSYQAYYQYKRGDGYRDNSGFNQQQGFAQLGYAITENMQIRLEYTHMDYLTQQAGGLSDVYFEEDHRRSFRDRNWFEVKWNTLALHYDYKMRNGAHFNVRAWGMMSSRNTLGFLGKITQQDPGGAREMLAGDFRNGGAEARFLKRYNFNKDTSKTAISGAFLIGGRFYQGHTTANQGLATDGYDPNFVYQNPDDLEGSSFSYPSQNMAAFAENILFLGSRWTVNAGVRFESIQSGSEGYYKRYLVHPVNNDTLDIMTIGDTNMVTRRVPLFGAGASFKVNKRTSLYTNFTQNYRAINFTDIRINNPNVVVDSLIKDEYGYTAELGFRGMKDNFWIYDVAGFYIFYGDKIGLAPKPGTVLKERTNIGNAQNYGVEIFSEFDFIKAYNRKSENTLSLFANFAYINANYITSKEASYVGNKVEYVSSFILKSGVRFKTKRWNWQVQGSYNSEQFSDATNSVQPSGDAVVGLIPSYMVFDLSGRYAFKKYFQLEFGVNNFTNAKYFTRRATGYPGPGILPSDGIGVYGTLQFKIQTKN